MSLGSKSNALVRGSKRRTGVRRKRAAGAKTTGRTARRIVILAELRAAPLPVLPTAEMVRAHAVLLPEAPSFNAQIEWIEPLRFDERLFASAQLE
jgi:hypothetical protein